MFDLNINKIRLDGAVKSYSCHLPEKTPSMKRFLIAAHLTRLFDEKQNRYLVVSAHFIASQNQVNPTRKLRPGNVKENRKVTKKKDANRAFDEAFKTDQMTIQMTRRNSVMWKETQSSDGITRVRSSLLLNVRPNVLSALNRLEDRQPILKRLLTIGSVNYHETYSSLLFLIVARSFPIGNQSVMSRISIFISLILVHLPKGD